MIPTPVPLTGEALLYKFLSSTPISTGIEKLDILIEGGLHAGEVVELYGKSNTGKTQLCHKIMASIACRAGNDVTGLYLDLGNDFSAARYLQYTTHYKNPKLDSIRVVREFGVNGVMKTLETVEMELRHCTSDFFEHLRLVIIDAIPFALYPVMAPRNPGRETQEKLVTMLRRLGFNHQLTFIIVNHAVTAKTPTVGLGHPTINNVPSKRMKAALGKYWSHIPNSRIFLTRGIESDFGSFGLLPTKNDSFRATLEKSGHGQPCRHFDFVITEDDII